MNLQNFPVELLAVAMTAWCRNHKIDLNKMDVTAILLWLDDISAGDLGVDYSQLEQVLYNTVKYESAGDILDEFGVESLEEVEEQGYDIIPLGHNRYLTVGY